MLVLLNLIRSCAHRSLLDYESSAGLVAYMLKRTSPTNGAQLTSSRKLYGNLKRKLPD